MAECEHARRVGDAAAIKNTALLHFLTHLLAEMARQGFQIAPLAEEMAIGHANFGFPESYRDEEGQEHFGLLLEEWEQYTEMVEVLADAQATGR